MSKYMYENKIFYYFESVLLVYRISLSFTIISKLQRKKKMTHFEKYFILKCADVVDISGFNRNN